MEPAQSDFYSDKNHSFDSNFGSKSPLPPSYADQPHKPFVESVHTPLTSNSPEPYYYTPDSYRSPAYYHSDFPDHRLDQNIDPYDSAYRYQRPVFPRNEGMYDYRPMERPPAMRPYYASSMQPSQPLYNPANYNYYPQERYMSYNYPPSTFSSSPFYSTGSMMPSANPYMDEFAYDGSPVEMDGGNVDLCDDDPAYTISINRINRGEEHRTVVLVRNIPNRLRKKDVTRVLANCVGLDNFYILRLPVDPFTKRNLGYAFVCFSTPNAVAVFYYNMNGQRWPSSNSQKRCTMCFAKKQNRVPSTLFGHHTDDDDNNSTNDASSGTMATVLTPLSSSN